MKKERTSGIASRRSREAIRWFICNETGNEVSSFIQKHVLDVLTSVSASNTSSRLITYISKERLMNHEVPEALSRFITFSLLILVINTYVLHYVSNE